MGDCIKLPVKTFPDGSQWVILSHDLGRKIRIRAHEIKKNKKKVRDYDEHHIDEIDVEQADAKYSIKCQSLRIRILDKILEI